ncbi:MAG: hypothetical protein MIO93_11805, partial [ANME-2 cluster archaeon]|nr:hypothetical protein [ANME-2 cluster archaeon]
MDNIRKFYLALAVAVIALVGIAIAVVPPPSANQDIGIYDSEFSVMVESQCRECHDSGVPDTHHLLVPSGEYACMDCHPTTPGDLTMERACEVCHIQGGILTPPLSSDSPHHASADAFAGQCSECHGSFVDDFDDGHYVPTYAPSLVTPDTSFKIFNDTSGRYWGGCEACHQEDSTATPFIQSNAENHHDIQLKDETTGDCSNACHRGSNFLDIRVCEDCHGVKSLHNIQYDFANTSGELGYGHVGDNWDCNGCHAFWDAGAAPLQGPITPDVTDVVSSAELIEGQSVTVTVSGSNFIIGADGAYDPEVIIVDGTNTETLTIDSASDNEIVATWTPAGPGRYALYVLKSDMRSRSYPIGVGVDVTITSAIIDGDNVVITGTGFSDTYDPLFSDFLGVTILHKVNKNKIVELP